MESGVSLFLHPRSLKYWQICPKGSWQVANLTNERRSPFSFRVSKSSLLLPLPLSFSFIFLLLTFFHFLFCLFALAVCRTPHQVPNRAPHSPCLLLLVLARFSLATFFSELLPCRYCLPLPTCRIAHCRLPHCWSKVYHNFNFRFKWYSVF